MLALVLWEATTIQIIFNNMNTELNEITERCRRVPIHRIIGDHRLNRKVKINCPFHSERTGSCTLFPAGGYHCYGCGAHGNTLDFVMKLSSKTDKREQFKEAISELKRYI